MGVDSSTTELNAAVTAIKNATTFISLHTATPGTTGASEVSGGSYARVATTWGSVSGGAVTGSQVTINVPTGVTITHWGLWTLVSGGTWYDGGALPVSQTYSSAGTYLLTPTLTAS